VPRIAITGHRDLDEPTTVTVDAAIRALLREAPGPTIVGISCLAAGADQIFARAVLDLGGRLEVIIPSAGYEATLEGTGFEELKGRAVSTRTLAHPAPGPGPFLDAGLQMLDRADRLFAVWDGHRARGVGGTAEIVEHARRRHMPVSIIWPHGATRTTRTEAGTGQGGDSSNEAGNL
jgi:hypothetical protein